MKTILVLLVFISLFLFSRSDKIVMQVKPSQPQQSSESITKDFSDLSNADVWEKIVKNPDSVTVPFGVYDGGRKGTILISGKLDSSQEYFQVRKVTMKWDNGTIQKMPLTNGIFLWKKEQGHKYIIEQDFNFDNRSDFSLFDNSGFVNFWYSTWLYSTNKLIFNNSISEISSPKVDKVHRQIISYHRLGGCEENMGYFKIVNNQAIPFKYVYNKEEKGKNCFNGPCCITYQKELIGGAWKTKRLGEWDLEIYDSLYAE